MKHWKIKHAVGLISTLIIAHTAMTGRVLRLDAVADGELDPAKTSDYVDRAY